jgi:hypothetical protein
MPVYGTSRDRTGPVHMQIWPVITAGSQQNAPAPGKVHGHLKLKLKLKFTLAGPRVDPRVYSRVELMV